MSLLLTSIISTDKLELPALLYEPDQETKKVAVWLHGMGDSGIFYNPARLNALGESLNKRGIALLAFNNRGAHNIKKIRILDETLPDEDQGYEGGTFYERITDCVKDIDGAVMYLKNQGYNDFYLIGHSTGANKICAYHSRAKNNVFSKYVLAGPGDDCGLFFNELGEDKFWSALKFAKQHLANDPKKIMPENTGMYPFTVQAAEDILDPDGAYNTFPFYEETTKRLGSKPLFKEFQTLDKPTLIIFGQIDEYAYTAGDTKKALDIFRNYTDKSIINASAYVLVPDADHSFHGQEKAFADRVAQWLAP